MPSNRLDTNTVEITSAQPPLRLVPATKAKVLIEVFVLAMNGRGTPTCHAAALAAWCNDCLVKPIDFDRLERFLVPFSPQSS